MTSNITCSRTIPSYTATAKCEMFLPYSARLTACINELATSYASHRLQLNAAKTEFMWFGSRSALSNIAAVPSTHSWDIDYVRDLGVYFDSELTMKRHVSRVASVCYCQLRKLHHLRRLVNQSVLKQVVTSFVLSRIDYCNSLLINLPTSTIAPVQLVQNDAARLVLGLDRRAHVTPALKQLYTDCHFLTDYNLKFLHSCTRCGHTSSVSCQPGQMRLDNVPQRQGRQFQFVLA